MGSLKKTGAAVAVALAIPTAVVNYTFPRLTVSEGLALVSYWDPWGKTWTACIGDTKGVTKGQHFTEQECLDATAQRLPDYWVPMVQAAPILGTDLVPVSFKSAWLQFTWNEGTGNFRRYIAPDLQNLPLNDAPRLREALLAACNRMFRFTRAGNDSDLLLPRRKREYADCVRDL